MKRTAPPWHLWRVTRNPGTSDVVSAWGIGTNPHGDLVFYDQQGHPKRVFAAGTWTDATTTTEDQA
jgi:hypothetical protein